MKIKKFENTEYSDDFNYPFGGHVFVLARYKKGWSSIGLRGFEDNEFVPCMISGNPTSKWGKRDLWIIGDTYSRNIDDFEIIKNSDKVFKEMIEMLSNSSKFNL